MSDPSESATPRCPECGSGRTEEIQVVPRDHEFRCRECGEEFDRDGGGKIVA